MIWTVSVSRQGTLWSAEVLQLGLVITAQLSRRAAVAGVLAAAFRYYADSLTDEGVPLLGTLTVKVEGR